MLITKNKGCIINFEIPLSDHLTKKFILNLVEGSRSASTRILNQHKEVMGCQWRLGLWKRSPYIQVSDVLCYKLIPIINEAIFIILYSMKQFVWQLSIKYRNIVLCYKLIPIIYEAIFIILYSMKQFFGS